MKLSRFCFYVAVLCWLGLSLPVQGQLFQGKVGPWEEVYNQDGIRILDRWITLSNPDKKLRERKGIMKVKCQIDQAFTTVCDPNSLKKWMNGVLACHDLNRTDNTWRNYTLFGLPWPFDDRELNSVYRYEEIAGGSKKLFITSIDTLSSYKHQPLKEYLSEWTFTPAASGYSEITMVSATKTPPLIPLFIQDPILLKIYKDNLHRLKNLLEKQENKI